MKKIILINETEQYDQKDLKILKDATNCQVQIVDFTNIEFLKQIIEKHERTALIGEQMWKVSSKLMRLKGLIVVNVFCDADAIESPTYNAANIASFDVDELGIKRIISLIKTWLKIASYQPDGIHDEYIKTMWEWGIENEKINLG